MRIRGKKRWGLCRRYSNKLDNWISEGFSIRIFSLSFKGFQIDGSRSGTWRWGIRWFGLVYWFWFDEGSGRCGLVNGSGGFQNGLKLGINHLVFGLLRFIWDVLRYWRRWWWCVVVGLVGGGGSVLVVA